MYIITKNLARTKAKSRAIDLTVLCLIQCLLFWCCFLDSEYVLGLVDGTVQIFEARLNSGKSRTVVQFLKLQVKAILSSMPTQQFR